MPAANAIALFQFEKNIEAAAEALLKSAGLAATFERLDNAEFEAATANRITVQASAFDRASEHEGMSADTTPRSFFNHFKGTLTYAITTRRDTTGRAYHELALGTIRALHAALVNPFTVAPALPYQIIKCAESGGSISFIKSGERDRSELTYDLEIGIDGDTLRFAATP